MYPDFSIDNRLAMCKIISRQPFPGSPYTMIHASAPAFHAGEREYHRSVGAPIEQEATMRTSTDTGPLTAGQQQLVMDNGGLIGWGLRRYARTAPEFWLEDLKSAAEDGLIRAAQKYDPAKGRFSTYAVLWIRQRIWQRIKELSQVRPQWSAQLEALGDLDLPSRYRDPPDHRSLDPERAASIAERLEQCRRVCPRLYWKILDQRYRLGLTLQVIGDELRLTKERVRQIQKKARAWICAWLGAEPKPLRRKRA